MTHLKIISAEDLRYGGKANRTLFNWVLLYGPQLKNGIRKIFVRTESRLNCTASWDVPYMVVSTHEKTKVKLLFYCKPTNYGIFK